VQGLWSFYAQRRRERKSACIFHQAFFFGFFFCFFLRSQISTAEAPGSCLRARRSQGRAQALPGGLREQAPACRTADDKQDTAKIKKKKSLKAPETFQNKTKWPHFQKPRVSAEGEARSHAEKPAQERAWSPADPSHPSQIHPSGPAHVGGELTQFSRRVWVLARPVSQHAIKKRKEKLNKTKGKKKKKKQKQICKFPVYKQHTALSGMVSRLGIKNKRKIENDEPGVPSTVPAFCCGAASRGGKRPGEMMEKLQPGAASQKTRAALHNCPFPTFRSSSQNPWEHAGSAWKPGKNKRGAGKTRDLARQKDGVGTQSCGSFRRREILSLFSAWKRHFSCREHPSKAGDVSWGTAGCRG